MNNNIQESRCSFEVSKLLKEKGFDCGCNRKAAFTDKNEFYAAEIDYTKLSNTNESYANGNILIPSHALAIEWIRVNFGIWFEITTHSCGDFYVKVAFCTEENWENLDFRAQMHEVNKKLWIYNSPQEATEAALLYVLNDLI